MLGLSQTQMSNDNRIRNTRLNLNLFYLWDPCRSYCSSQVTRLNTTLPSSEVVVLNIMQKVSQSLTQAPSWVPPRTTKCLLSQAGTP